MKYTYIYKSSDGVRHEDVMNAESREAVFETLRTKGIRAIKVIAADGSKANGEVRGIRKRVLAASVLGAAVLAVGGTVLFLSREKSYPTSDAKPLVRQQIDGSRARIENLPGDLFKHKAEFFLARFAEPGRKFSAPETEWPSKAEVEEALNDPLRIGENEFTEYIDLKRIVEGMKREMAEYLRSGGLVSGYIRELVKRQQTEIGYREKAMQQLDQFCRALNQRTNRPDDAAIRAKKGQEAYDYWLKANAQLQSMGIAPLRIPQMLLMYRASVFE